MFEQRGYSACAVGAGFVVIAPIVGEGVPDADPLSDGMLLGLDRIAPLSDDVVLGLDGIEPEFDGIEPLFEGIVLDVVPSDVDDAPSGLVE